MLLKLLLETFVYACSIQRIPGGLYECDKSKLKSSFETSCVSVTLK